MLSLDLGVPNHCVKHPQAKALGRIFGAISARRPYYGLYSMPGGLIPGPRAPIWNPP